MDINQILTDDKDLQVLLVHGLPKNAPHKSKMADGRHLENQKIAIFPQQLDQFWHPIDYDIRVLRIWKTQHDSECPPSSIRGPSSG